MQATDVTLNGTAKTKGQGSMPGVYGLPTNLMGLPLIGGYSGTYEMYRRMGTVPTIALGTAAMLAPIRAAKWSVEADDDAPPGAKELIQDMVQQLRPTVMQDALRAITYGNQPFENVWAMDGKYAVIDRMKPLLPDITKILEDQDTGEVVGLANTGAELYKRTYALYAYDAEAGNPYGRSRYENIRANAYRPWLDTAEKLSAYTRKVANVILMLHYPDGGDETMADGSSVTSAEAAKSMMNQLARNGGSVAVPNKYQPWAHDLIRAGADPSKLLAWRFEFLEAGTPHEQQMIGVLQYHDVQMVRGLLMPERSVLEGQHGTKADAASHADVFISVAQNDSDGTVRWFNQSQVDSVLAVNFGPDVVGKVRVVAAPIIDDDKNFLRSVFGPWLSHPANADIVQATTDLNQVFDRLGLPKFAEVVRLPAPVKVTDTGTPGAPTKPPEGPAVAAARKLIAARRKGAA